MLSSRTLLRSFACASAFLAATTAFGACRLGNIPIGDQPTSCNTASDCPSGEPCVSGLCAGGGMSVGSAGGACPGPDGTCIGGVGGSEGMSSSSGMSFGTGGAPVGGMASSSGGMVTGVGGGPSQGVSSSVGAGGASFGSGGAPSGGMVTSSSSGGGAPCVNDGDCKAGQTCVGGVCTGPCISATCVELGFDCGEAADGCGGVVFCGTCPSGKTCGASTPNVCG